MPAIAEFDHVPQLRDDILPPLLHGTAMLGTLAYRGHPIRELLAFIGNAGTEPGREAAVLLDQSLAHQLTFGRALGLGLQDEALERCRLYRVRREPDVREPEAGGPPVRLLAFMAPGDLMVNTPLDFLTAFLNVRLDLLYLVPGVPLPATLPDHDVAICAVSDADQAALARLVALTQAWPRPVLNDPRRIMPFSRDWLVRTLAGIPGLHCAQTVRTDRATLALRLADGAPIGSVLPGGDYPVLLRPLASHAGQGLAKAETQTDIRRFLDNAPGDAFYLTQFVDYRSPDGWYRKYRVAFIDGAPFLCHMAVSERWMIHYLNAGMAESAAKRADEAWAMATFDEGFAARHHAAFAALAATVGLDFFSIDCGETTDGRLLVFEADVAAIIHAMDPPDLFAYKQPAMRRCFDAFHDLLQRRSAAAAAAG